MVGNFICLDQEFIARSWTRTVTQPGQAFPTSAHLGDFDVAQPRLSRSSY